MPVPHPLLPSLAALPAAKPGHRVDLPALAGSSDALAISALGTDTMQVVVVANPIDAQRLRDEILWFAPELRVCVLPDWETLPYDALSPHQDLVSERLATLYTVTRGEADVVLVPASTALYRMAPPSFLAAHTFFVKRGERMDGDAFREQMTLAGYAHVTQVVSPGEYSVRGGIIDLFPMGSTLPYRIDLFDDDVDTIRTFDPDTQRTVYPVDQIRLLPAREFPLDEAGRTRFRSSFRETFEGDPSRASIYKDVSNGIASAGVEYFLPLFFEDTATLFDYLPTACRVLLHGDVPTAIADFWRDTQSRYDLLKGDRSRPVMAPRALFLDQEAFFSRLADHPRLQIGAPREGEVASTTMPTVAVERKANDPLQALKRWLDGFDGRVLVLAESAGRRETMAEYFAEYDLAYTPSDDLASFLSSDAPLCLSAGPLTRGFILPEAKLAILTETELYANTARTQRRRDGGRKATVEGWLRDLSELKIGDPVVHVSHGVGRYLGLVHMDLGEGDTEFLHLEYSNNDKLYVPVSQLHVITRYAGADPEAVDLHRLGSGQWDKAKKKAAQQVRDTAAELLALYAQRAARTGHKFSFKTHDLDAFAEAFGFEETADQQAAIDAVIKDMQSGRPMDRLVCGDVGFGKTEVALRAAFIAVADGKQVVVLCPTTLLAEQHYQTFADRFADWPIKIAELSRFKSAKEQTQALKELDEGKVDIIIGTHRLLQKDVQYKRLGLVIIDEEHRFGVRQKESLKQLRAEVDILTLTATPIPRTLGLALEGLREFSVIATAPQKRLSIKTFVQRWSKGIIREAVLREFKRGGQVYFLHNEVDTIENVRDSLTELLPEARIVVGHGQLPERELERVMRDFTQQRANLLLCTTIIETGINIPTANTIIMNRADRFGLAQLHQLRGRVGRSHHQAYAYLLTDAHAKPTALAQKRLEAITQMEDLGSGFFLAMHDLEIRGAGEVLGENQSGEIQQIGFSLYTEMLKRAVRDLQAGREPDLTKPLDVVSEINLHSPALLPSAYCADVQERLTLYKRLANTDTEDELRELQEELIDRFGEMPPQTLALLETHRLRVMLKDMDVVKLDVSESQLSIQFGVAAPIDPMKVIGLIQKDRNTRMAGQDRLICKILAPTVKQRAAAVKELLKLIT
ncbi:transcription-repair coupling factor [Denitromonas halophila]|uniref:Transcription-repair-coupling factor n=1 Tax=Denitromonas halophila TaxID=1629404 RepID=A0A557QK00_9RHOO|nr:transcription-repair coupling factor [Denitromonas halophila]TVO53233.1 transcription-repair coupling factor [Denitromonas halophila]